MKLERRMTLVTSNLSQSIPMITPPNMDVPLSSARTSVPYVSDKPISRAKEDKYAEGRK